MHTMHTYKHICIYIYSESFEFVLNFPYLNFFEFHFYGQSTKKGLPATTAICRSVHYRSDHYHKHLCNSLYTHMCAQWPWLCCCVYMCLMTALERFVGRVVPSTSRWEHACVSCSWDIFVFMVFVIDLYIYSCTSSWQFLVNLKDWVCTYHCCAMCIILAVALATRWTFS